MDSCPAKNFINFLCDSFGLKRLKVYFNNKFFNNHKAIRFKLIQSCLEKVVPQFERIYRSENLGFSQEEIDAIYEVFPKLERYDKLNIIAGKLIEIFKREIEAEFFEIYTAALKAEKAKSESDEEMADFNFDMKFETEHIDAAIRNAIYLYLGLTDIIPRLYFVKYNKDVGPEDYKKIYRFSIKFARQMCLIHFDIFRAFVYTTTQLDKGRSNQLHVFSPRAFELNELDEIVFKEGAVEEIKREAKKLYQKGNAKLDGNDPVLACPAAYARNDGGIDMVDMFHEWIYQVLLRFFF